MYTPRNTETITESVRNLKDYLINTTETNEYGAIVAVRTNKKIALELLLNNESTVKDGCVRYFQIKDIGLGVYEVKLRESGKINTYKVDSWERQVVANPNGGPGSVVFWLKNFHLTFWWGYGKVFSVLMTLWWATRC